VKRWPLFVFLFGALVCLSMSTIFHLFFVHSQECSNFLARLDYAGISFLIGGSCYPMYFYSYFCHTNLQVIYLTSITTLCLSCFLCSLSKDFTSPSKRGFRGLLYLLAGISAGFPVIHLGFLYNTDGMIPNQSLILWVLGGISYILGACIYICRFPEKFWPGKFCYIGSSHQIWHCFVLMGIMIHFFASVNLYHERLSNSYCPNI